jgi:hypothetical protein
MPATPTTFAERHDATAADLALFYAGHEDAAESLAAMRARMLIELTERFPHTDTNLRAMVDQFIQAIVERKTEIERDARGAGYRPKLN